MNIVEEIQNDLSGMDLLRDWLGDGDVVHDMVSEARASYCIKCPKNVEPNWWGRVKSRIADTIRKQLELKSKMNLHVKCEDDLHMCSACGCCLKLKVWAPWVHVEKHLSKDVLTKCPSACWMVREYEDHQTNERVQRAD